MSEKIYCKDCRFCGNGFCHRMPPVLVSWYKDALFPKVDDFDWCGMAERKEEAGVRVGKKQASRQRIDTEAPNKATKTIKGSRYAKIQKPEIRQLNSHYGQGGGDVKAGGQQ